MPALIVSQLSDFDSSVENNNEELQLENLDLSAIAPDKIQQFFSKFKKLKKLTCVDVKFGNAENQKTFIESLGALQSLSHFFLVSCKLDFNVVGKMLVDAKNCEGVPSQQVARHRGLVFYLFALTEKYFRNKQGNEFSAEVLPFIEGYIQEVFSKLIGLNSPEFLVKVDVKNILDKLYRIGDIITHASSDQNLIDRYAKVCVQAFYKSCAVNFLGEENMPKIDSVQFYGSFSAMLPQHAAQYPYPKAFELHLRYLPLTDKSNEKKRVESHFEKCLAYAKSRCFAERRNIHMELLRFFFPKNNSFNTQLAVKRDDLASSNLAQLGLKASLLDHYFRNHIADLVVGVSQDEVISCEEHLCQLFVISLTSDDFRLHVAKILLAYTDLLKVGLNKENMDQRLSRLTEMAGNLTALQQEQLLRGIITALSESNDFAVVTRAVELAREKKLCLNEICSRYAKFVKKIITDNRLTLPLALQISVVLNQLVSWNQSNSIMRAAIHIDVINEACDAFYEIVEYLQRIRIKYMNGRAEEQYNAHFKDYLKNIFHHSKNPDVKRNLATYPDLLPQAFKMKLADNFDKSNKEDMAFLGKIEAARNLPEMFLALSKGTLSHAQLALRSEIEQIISNIPAIGLKRQNELPTGTATLIASHSPVIPSYPSQALVVGEAAEPAGKDTGNIHQPTNSL